jgi:hypothetical protein
MLDLQIMSPSSGTAHSTLTLLSRPLLRCFAGQTIPDHTAFLNIQAQQYILGCLSMSLILASGAPTLPAHMTSSKARTLIASGSLLMPSKRVLEEYKTTSSLKSSIQKASLPCNFGSEASQPSLPSTITYPLRMVAICSIAKLPMVLYGEYS